MLYQLMKADLRKPSIKTLEEFFQSNLTFYEYINSVASDKYFEEQMNI